MKKTYIYMLIPIFLLSACNTVVDERNSIKINEAAGDSGAQPRLKIQQYHENPDSRARSMGYINRYELNKNLNETNRIIANVDRNDFEVENLPDVQQARKIVQQTGFQPGAIWTEGEFMWVHVYTTKSLSNDQYAKTESAIYQKLKKALPQYKIEIRLLKTSQQRE